METIATFNGVTDEFLWYELEVVSTQLSGALARMKRLEATVKAREQEKDEYIRHLMATISYMRKQLADAEEPKKPARKAAKKE
jgi:hypothetical protein